MARKSRSSIEKHGLQEFVGHLFESGATYEQIIAKVREVKQQRLTRSALSRYHTTWASAEEQIRLAGQDSEAILKMLRMNPNMNFTESAIQMVLGKMTRRLANANESFEQLPLDKLSALLAKIARVQIESAKVQAAAVDRPALYIECLRDFTDYLTRHAPDALTQLEETFDGFLDEMKRKHATPVTVTA